ncbi:SLATT domain-containing protein [Shewanella nanhaiensis]|uniref:SLATT domain-containing protein n=1 Tax=Shewanella nanhaiensis TaxID=2864872 RepID=A0ABS7E5X6_9GAMM|nr:SLATT domain-containing protein [Shewanella nanhaiensis]MBW8185093.1 SLATT domain-containing protein [Shewanella nanhaiensis]
MTDSNGRKNSSATIDFFETLNKWLTRCQEARDGHYKRSEALFARAQVLGYALIYCTIFVTAFSFFQFSSSNDTSVSVDMFYGITNQYIVIFVGVAAAVISGTTTQSRHGERAEVHRSLAARYANLVRNVEALTLKAKTSLVNDEQTLKELDNIVTQWNYLSENSLLTVHKPERWKVFFNIILACLITGLFYLVSTSTSKSSVVETIPKANGSTVINLNCTNNELPEELVNALKMHVQLYKK